MAAEELRGYLRKKSRQGRWQRRFFQTSNQYLCYYKNQDSQDLLACIDLRSVGDIAKVEAAEAPSAEFYLQLGGRRYYIKAKTPENAELWVAGLKKRRDGDAATARSEAAAKLSKAVSPKQVQLQEVAASASASGKPATASGDVDKSMRGGGVCGSCVVL